MKVTKHQLRQLIKEEVSKIREQTNIEGVELTEPGANEASISAAWPD